MPSQRRVKTFILLVLLIVLVTLYITGSARQTRSSEFYTKTSAALEEKRAAALRAEEQAAAQLERPPAEDGKMKERLREAEEQAKKNADRKGEQAKQEVFGASGEKS